MVSIRLLLSLALASAGVQVLGQSTLSGPLAMDSSILYGRLDNGLTYYIRQNRHPERKVELRLALRVGSLQEDDDQQGLAHLLEHMAFNGTEHYPKNDIYALLADMGIRFGSDFNARTNYNITHYILPIPMTKPGNLAKGFQVLEDWAHGISLRDEDIDNERAVVLEEMRLGNRAMSRMYRRAVQELGAGTRYADRASIGTDSSIRNFHPDAVRRFYRDWYRPDLMAVMVVGDVPPQEALALVKRHFNGLRQPPSPRARVDIDLKPFTARKTRVWTDRELTGYQLIMDFPPRIAAPISTYPSLRARYLNALFTFMLTARLREAAEGSPPAFDNAFAEFITVSSFDRHIHLRVEASMGMGDIRQGVDAVFREIERVRRFGFTHSELERAKKEYMLGYEFEARNSDKTESDVWAERMISHFMLGDVVLSPDVLNKAIGDIFPTIAPADFRSMIDTLLKDGVFGAYLSGPPAAPGLSLPSPEELSLAWDAQARAAMEPYSEDVVPERLMQQMPKKGSIRQRRYDAALGTTELTLGNGVRVTLKKTDFTEDQVLLSGYRAGGWRGYGPKDLYSAMYATQVVSSMGYANLSPKVMEKVLAGKFAQAMTAMDADGDYFNGDSNAEDIEAMFQLLHLQATTPRRDSALFQSWQQKGKAKYQSVTRNSGVWFTDTLHQVLYSGDPKAPGSAPLFSYPRSEHFDRIELDRVLAIYRERFGDLSGMHFTIVGNFTEERILPLVETYLASLPASGRKSLSADTAARPFTGAKQLVLRKGRNNKGLLLAVYTGEVGYSASMVRKFQALSQVMDLFIIAELRERIQGIYAGSSTFELKRFPRSTFNYSLQLPCNPEKADTLLKAFRLALDELAEKGPAPDQLEKVKTQLLEVLRTNGRTNEYWLSRLRQLHVQELTRAEFLTWSDGVKALTPDDVREAARLVRQASTQLVGILLPEGR
jgi:zinc protease